MDDLTGAEGLVGAGGRVFAEAEVDAAAEDDAELPVGVGVGLRMKPFLRRTREIMACSPMMLPLEEGHGGIGGAIGPAVDGGGAHGGLRGERHSITGRRSLHSGR